MNYLKALLGDPRHDILFVGYQAAGTPGRDIQRYGPRGGEGGAAGDAQGKTAGDAGGDSLNAWEHEAGAIDTERSLGFFRAAGHPVALSPPASG
ncbi:hypothetical protein [Lamprobacter modestohalophilus]|uniref:hypothetical protein n=1 Tax=Lamprobacter modestohalophilus TaxID=1064514 RepID=UPI001F5BD916|nr:hypothetical protein [Lamprobacter modestohalophilus]